MRAARGGGHPGRQAGRRPFPSDVLLPLFSLPSWGGRRLRTLFFGYGGGEKSCRRGFLRSTQVEAAGGCAFVARRLSVLSGGRCGSGLENSFFLTSNVRGLSLFCSVYRFICSWLSSGSI